MKFMKKAIPAVTLLIICAVSALLLVFVHDLTAVDEETAITPEIEAALYGIYGASEEFTVYDTPLGGSETAYVNMSLRGDAGDYAFIIVSNGYNKEGLTLLVALDSTGAVKGIVTLESAETPGLGTKTDSPEFMGQFSGFTIDDLPIELPPDETIYKVRFAKSEVELEALKASQPEVPAAFEWDAITGATLSSNGVYEAVKLAVTAFREVHIG
ncbi:MAG: FMN-binding protein [Ruminococcus sp.]|jgi:Na+-translocating ferredoxin:NAD+ oxidoreductase RnfG subunit|nr:FMN-binding protein [Ruminococcus sp.]